MIKFQAESNWKTGQVSGEVDLVVAEHKMSVGDMGEVSAGVTYDCPKKTGAKVLGIGGYFGTEGIDVSVPFFSVKWFW